MTDDVAKAASASLGDCEAFPYLDGSMTVDDMTFLEAPAQGQTFLASAGDTGSFCPASVVGGNGVPAGYDLTTGLGTLTGNQLQQAVANQTRPAGRPKQAA